METDIEQNVMSDFATLPETPVAAFLRFADRLDARASAIRASEAAWAAAKRAVEAAVPAQLHEEVGDG